MEAPEGTIQNGTTGLGKIMHEEKHA